MGPNRFTVPILVQGKKERERDGYNHNVEFFEQCFVYLYFELFKKLKIAKINDDNKSGFL